MSHLALLKRGNGKSKKRRSSTSARDKVNSPAPVPLPIHRFGAVATPNRAVLSGGGGTLPQPGTLQYLCQFCRAPVPPPTPSQLLLSSKSSVVFCHLCLSCLFSLSQRSISLAHPFWLCALIWTGPKKRREKKVVRGWHPHHVGPHPASRTFCNTRAPAPVPETLPLHPTISRPHPPREPTAASTELPRSSSSSSSFWLLGFCGFTLIPFSTRVFASVRSFSPPCRVPSTPFTRLFPSYTTPFLSILYNIQHIIPAFYIQPYCFVPAPSLHCCIQIPSRLSSSQSRHYHCITILAQPGRPWAHCHRHQRHIISVLLPPRFDLKSAAQSLDYLIRLSPHPPDSTPTLSWDASKKHKLHELASGRSFADPPKQAKAAFISHLSVTTTGHTQVVGTFHKTPS